MEENTAPILVDYDRDRKIVSVDENKNADALNQLKGTPAEMSATESVKTKKPSELAKDAADAAADAAASGDDIITLQTALNTAVDALTAAATKLDPESDAATAASAAATAADSAATGTEVEPLKIALTAAVEALRNASTALSGLSKGGKRRSKKGTKKVSKKGSKKRSSKKSRGGKSKKQRGGALDFSFFGKESHIETGVDKSTSVAGSLNGGLHPVVPRIQGGSSKIYMNGGGCGLAPQMGGGEPLSFSEYKSKGGRNAPLRYGGSALAFSNYKGGKRRTKGGNKSNGMRGGSARKY